VPYRRKKLTFAISSPDEFLYNFQLYTVHKNFPLPPIAGPKTAGPGTAVPTGPSLMRHWVWPTLGSRTAIKNKTVFYILIF